MEGIKIRKPFTLKIFFLAIAMIGCSSYSKDDYLSYFKIFVSNIEMECKNYSANDWENSDIEYQQLTNEYYEEYKGKFTDDDQRLIGKLKAKYQVAKIKCNAGKIIDKAGEGLNQLEGIIEGVIESVSNP